MPGRWAQSLHRLTGVRWKDPSGKRPVRKEASEGNEPVGKDPSGKRPVRKEASEGNEPVVGVRKRKIVKVGGE